MGYGPVNIQAPVDLGSTDIDGMVKGDGVSFLQATADVDYATPAYVDAAVNGIHGLVKSNGHGLQEATADVDYATPGFVTETVNAAVVGVYQLQGNTDCSGNPNYPAGIKGDIYVVSVAGKIGGASGITVDVADQYLCINDADGGTQAAVGTSWVVLEHNLVQALINGGALGTPSSGNLGNCTGLPTAGISDAASGATISVTVKRDANANAAFNNLLEGYTTTVTAAGTTTLTVASTYQQFFTGTTTQTCKLPVASTLVLGQSFYITNSSTGIVTVQSSGANTILTMPANTSAIYTCILISGTGTASWSWNYVGYSALTGTGANVLANSPALVTPDIGAATGTSALFSSGSAAGFGFTTAAGSKVTQTSSRTNGVTINNLTGKIQTDTTSLGTLSSAVFTVTNSTVAVGDVPILALRSGQSGAGKSNTLVSVDAVAAGSFNIRVYNGSSLATEDGALIINFVVIKGGST